MGACSSSFNSTGRAQCYLKHIRSTAASLFPWFVEIALSMTLAYTFLEMEIALAATEYGGHRYQMSFTGLIVIEPAVDHSY